MITRLGALGLLLVLLSSGTVPAQDKKESAEETKARKLLGDDKLLDLLSPMVLKAGEKPTPYTFTIHGSGYSLRNRSSFDTFMYNHARAWLKANGKSAEDADGKKEVERREALALRAGYDNLFEVFNLLAKYELKEGERDQRFLTKQQVRTLLADELDKKDKKDRWVVDRLRNCLETDAPLPKAITLPKTK